MLGFTVAIVRPQRKYKHYLLDCLVLMILSLLILTTIGRSFQDDNSIQEHTAHLFQNIAVGLPIVYISGVVIYFFFVKTKILQQLKKLPAVKIVSLEQCSLLNDQVSPSH